MAKITNYEAPHCVDSSSCCYLVSKYLQFISYCSLKLEGHVLQFYHSLWNNAKCRLTQLKTRATCSVVRVQFPVRVLVSPPPAAHLGFCSVAPNALSAKVMTEVRERFPPRPLYMFMSQWHECAAFVNSGRFSRVCL
jgi:hypothetical protein